MKIDKISKKCIKLLRKKNKKVVVSESLTGGKVCDALVSISGASSVFEEGFITYSDAAKSKNLGVNYKLIQRKGVVSKEVAKAMAVGALKNTDADYAIATTGVAGPNSDDYNTPVGTVYIACATRNRVVVRLYKFKGKRQEIRENSTKEALVLLLTMLKGKR